MMDGLKTTTALEFLSHLRSLDVRLWVDNRRLRCSAPTGVITPALRAELNEHKEELLKILLGLQNSSRTDLPILPVPRKNNTPLSFAQQRLWLLDQLEPENAAYNISSTVWLNGGVDIGTLERSLNAVVEHHEVLRTTFTTDEDGHPVQIISPVMRMRLPTVDLEGLPEAEQKPEIRRLAIEEARQPFDLERGPLVRGFTVWLDKKDAALFLTMHHIVSDGWSMGILRREVMTLYEAFSNGEPSPLPELPVQYADFAVWQREWLQGEVLERQLSYWKEQLSAVSALELPTDRPRPPLMRYRGAVESFEISRALTAALKKVGQQEDCTLFMVLLAAFQVLLHRYTGQEDIAVGTPIANRNRAEIERLIGFFVNTLVLRTDLSGNPTFRELLRRVHEVALAAYEHQDLPFEKLVDELQPERHLNRSPLFQVMFTLQNVESPGPINGDSGTSKFDLTLFLTETENGLRGDWEYDTDLFDAATIARLGRHLQALMGSIAEKPEQRISDLAILTNTEQRQLLVEWNDTQTDYPRNTCIHELFEAQVEQTPDAVAVVFEDQHLTYRELNRQANQLAHYLRTLGVEVETLVGIYVERSAEMVVATLGILKAGGAYLPLDMAYPKERLAFMLEDGQSPVLVTQQQWLQELPGDIAEIVCIDRDWALINQHSDINPEKRNTVENLAYVMYTSGSTGIPKGISIPHLAVNRLVMNTDYIELGPLDRVGQAANISFDAATFEIWGALLHGGSLVIITKDVVLSPQEFAGQICRQEISALFLTTALFNHLAQYVKSPFSQVRHLLFGGQAVDPRWVREMLDNDPPGRLLHVYGPTETTTYATWFLVEGMSENAVTVPIGGPIANTQIYVLDRHLQPVPVGIPGELYIGGDGLARGYFRRQRLTAERFIPDPFGGGAGTRLYRTGDLVRYLPDGNVEFLGRTDLQVKIRGFRVELGEIEAALARHEQVREAVIVAREDVPGDKRLVAYVVLCDGYSASVGELRSFLERELPDYMIPSAFVFLEALPLTPNGKVDRHALPAPEGLRPELKAAYVAPRNDLEATIARVWQQVLQVERVGIHDNFFELGGDSLLLMQIVARARQTGIQFTPRQLMKHQTIAELAEIEGTSVSQAEQGLVTGPLPLTIGQRWFLGMGFTEPDRWNGNPMFEVPQINPVLVEQVVQHLLIHHDALRSRFVRDESGWRAFIAEPDGIAPVIYVDLSNVPEMEHETEIWYVGDDIQGSLSLSQGPLLRVGLYDLGADRPGRLHIAIHHMASDAYSTPILLEDFQTAYQQVSRGEQILLPPKTTSIKQWLTRLTSYAQSAELRQELDYWFSLPQTQIRPLPVDYPDGRQNNTTASLGLVEARLSSAETDVLLRQIPKMYGAQILDALLMALVQAVSKWTGRDWVGISLTDSGRSAIPDAEDVDLSRTVGWLAHAGLVSLKREETDNPGDALRSIRDQFRRIPNRGLGFDLLHRLSEDNEIVERLSHLLVADLKFNYLGGTTGRREDGTNLVRPVQEPCGDWQNPQNHRTDLLFCLAFIAERQLAVRWEYSENIYKRATIEALANNFIETLQELITHAESDGRN